MGGGAANIEELATEPVRQIIGVVGDVRSRQHRAGSGADDVPAARADAGCVERVDAERRARWAGSCARASSPGTVSGQIQDVIRETTGVPVTNVQNMDDIVSLNTSRQRLNMLLMTIFGVSALVLAAIGIYGLMAYSVQHRTQEIGIRMALGAQADRVRWSIVGQGMTLVGVGIVVGIVAAFFLATFLAAVLYGVQARDVMVFVGVPTVLAATAFAAVWIAARRASRIRSARGVALRVGERLVMFRGCWRMCGRRCGCFRTSPGFAAACSRRDRARHRHDDGDLLRRQRRGSEARAVPRAGPHRPAASHARRRGVRHERFADQVHGVARASRRGLQRPRGVHEWSSARPVAQADAPEAHRRRRG